MAGRVDEAPYEPSVRERRWWEFLRLTHARNGLGEWTPAARLRDETHALLHPREGEGYGDFVC